MELVIIRGTREVGRLRLSEGTFSIGRGPQNTVSLDEQSVSRRHARIVVEDGRVVARDLGSVNGTLLRGQRLEEAELSSGDILEIGPFFIHAVFDDEDFVSHDLERTETHINLRELERSGVGQLDTVNMSRPSPVESVEKSDSDEDSKEQEGASDWMEPHVLFELVDEGWLEQAGAGAGAMASPRQGRLEAPLGGALRNEAPEPVWTSSEEVSMLSEEVSNGPEGEAGWDSVEDDFDQLEVEELGYDDWREDSAARAETPRLPKTPNLAESRQKRSQGVMPGYSPGVSGESPEVEGEGPQLVLKTGFAKKELVELSRGTSFIGRAEEMEIVLLDTNASRRHAAISWEDGHFVLRDLWSLNGVSLNGERVTMARLRSGNRIQIGDTVFEFVWPGEPLSEVDEAPTLAPRAPEETVRREEKKETPPERAPEPAPAVIARAKSPPPKASLRFSASPTLAILLVTVIIVIGAVASLVLRDREAPRAIAGRAERQPLLSAEAQRLMVRSETLMTLGEFDDALELAMMVQVAEPSSREAHRLVSRICEARAIQLLKTGLVDRLVGADAGAGNQSNEGTPEAQATPEVVATPEAKPADSSAREPALEAPVAKVAALEKAVVTSFPSTKSAVPQPGPSRPEPEPPVAPRKVSGTALERQVAALYQTGLAARDRGRYLEAIRAFERAKGEDPYKETELYYQIEDEIKATTAKLDEMVRPIVAEASVMAEAGHLVEARQKLADAVSKDPYYAPAVSKLRQVEKQLAEEAKEILVSAQAQEEAGAAAEAEQLYRKVLTLVPDPSNVHHQRAALRLEQLKQGR